MRALSQLSNFTQYFYRLFLILPMGFMFTGALRFRFISLSLATSLGIMKMIFDAERDKALFIFSAIPVDYFKFLDSRGLYTKRHA